MNIKKLNKNELDEVTKLYIKERNNFCWLISIEEFVKDYVKQCGQCFKYYVDYDNNDVCDDCFEEECEDTRSIDEKLWDYGFNNYREVM